VSDSFGKKIRDRRLELDLTLEEVAEKLGTKKNYVWQLENKSPARPSGQLLLRFAKVLDVSPDYLIDDEAEKPTKDHLEDAFFRKADGMNLTEEDMDKIFKILKVIKD